MTKKNKFVTDDKFMSRGQRSTVDDRVLRDAGRGVGVEITSVEALMELAKAAKATHDQFAGSIRKKMTQERAERIRELRIEEGCTWRCLAEICYQEWGKDADWMPPSNQLAGVALCEIAAEVFKEDSTQEPWN